MRHEVAIVVAADADAASAADLQSKPFGLEAVVAELTLLAFVVVGIQVRVVFAIVFLGHAQRPRFGTEACGIRSDGFFFLVDDVARSQWWHQGCDGPRHEDRGRFRGERYRQRGGQPQWKRWQDRSGAERRMGRGLLRFAGRVRSATVQGTDLH